MHLTSSGCKEYYGDSECDFLLKIKKKCESEFCNNILSKSANMRTHARFDLRDGNLPKFSIYHEIGQRALSEMLVINDSLNVFSVEDVMLDEMFGIKDFDFSKDLDETSEKYGSLKMPDLNKMVSQLNEVIQLLRKDHYNRRLVACSLDPCKEDNKSTDSHMIFQFIVNFGKLNGCLYLTSCDLAWKLPLLTVLFSLIIHVVGCTISVSPGELVVFVELTALSETALKLVEQLTIPNLLSPKVKIVQKGTCSSLKERPEDGMNLNKINDLLASKVLLDKKTKDIKCLFDEDFCTVNREEAAYLNLLRDIISEGNLKPNRTGIDTMSLTGICMVYNLRNGVIPVLTTKRVFWKGVVEELLWFIKGSTNANDLAGKGVHIWDANGSRQFLDSLGFEDREEGDLGPVYGFQWRHFGAEYHGMRENYSGQGVDQLKLVINNIKQNNGTGLTTVTSWNSKDLEKMVLPSCHVAFHFTVSDGELSCSMYQRSADMGLGVPFNIASYSLLTHMVAHVTGLKAGDFVHCLGDAHVYENHVEPLMEQINNRPQAFPQLIFKRNIFSIDDFTSEDFELSSYTATNKIKLKMAL